jgi:Tol biopolymer transport system component
MPLSPGHRLGPYEIVAPLGAGGMGEVYRARDTRLGREVAVKVLPENLARDEAARGRFEREARAVAALSHPNILAIHDLGRDEAAHYAVMELLAGETLRDRLGRSELSIPKAIDYASQIAQGLAAAHERGITHRDVKPENLFVTTTGLVKILDFGLARETSAGAPADSRVQTAAQLTEPGMVVGTVGYMSPEQVRGAVADHRSDIFSFGCVLHEMLGGRRPFQRDTRAETMTAILREAPLALSTLRPEVSPALEQVVLHCLEKEPGERFQSMSDVVFSLRAPTSASSPAARSGPVVVGGFRQRARPLAWFAAGLAATALVWLAWGLSRSPARAPSFQRLTFQRGTIYSARLAPDGQTVVYGASWSGRGIQLYSARLDSATSRPMGVAADVLAISPSGEMALSLDRRTKVSFLSTGRLARAPLGGGAPREILDGVVDADWSPDGNELAVTREAGAEAVLEYPIGHVLYRGAGYLSAPRVSPDGKAVAFVRHQLKGDDRGNVALVDTNGNVRTLSPDLPSVTGVAWSPNGREVWYSAWIVAGGHAIEAVTPGAGRRVVFRSGARIRLLDVQGGRALVAYETTQAGISGRLRADEREHDVSFLDGSIATDLTPEGDALLFCETGVGGGPGYSFFVRKASDGEPVRLGEGWGSDLTRDGQWALSYPVDPPMHLTITPTGPGTARTIDLPGLEAVGGATWLPDEKRILFWGSETGEAFRGYVIDLPDGRPRPVTPSGVTPPLVVSATHTVSPDGRWIAALDPAGAISLYPVAGGGPRPVPGAGANDVPVAWAASGRELLVRRQGELPARVYRLDLGTGRRALWKELVPADPSGVVQIMGVVATPDLRHFAYTYLRLLTELYVVDGLQ